METKNLEMITELRHILHAFPELSGEEFKTKEILMDFLKMHTTLELVDRGRWFYAFYKSQRPEAKALAFRADFDALPMDETLVLPYASKSPGISHKCGHDGHSAVLAGLALEISRLGAECDIYFIFQHGEEIGMGGEACSELIPEKNICRAFAFHNMSGYPRGSIAVKRGVAQCASKGLTIYLAGTPAHASQPEDGRNPSEAIARIVLETRRLENCGNYEGMVMATIVHMETGSKNFGIAAACGEISMTLRGDYERDMGKLETEIRQFARTLAADEKLDVSFTEHDVFPETVNETESVTLVRRAAESKGLRFIEMEEPFRASEDFGYYLKRCPGAIFYVGNGETYPQLHTLEYDFNDSILETVVEMFQELVRLSECRIPEPG